MKCRRCQQDNPAAQKFCGECGTPLKAVGHTDPPAPSYAEVTSALDEALEQQAATREILRVISGSPTDVQPVLNVVAENAARLCGADDAVIQRVDGGALRFAAHFGRIPTPPEHALMPITREMAVGSAVLDRRTVHVHDMAEELRRGKYPASRPYRDCDPYRTLLCVPLVREDVAVGVIVMRRAQVQPFTDEQIALVKTFADQAVIAIENARLFRDLSESLDQQTATSEILRVISSSLTDIQPVLDRMAESAARFCQAYDATIFRANGDELRLVAHHGAISSLPLGSIIPLTPAGVATRAVLERRPIHVADIELEADEFPVAAAHARALGNRTMLAVPLLREQVALGAILLRRIEPDPFTDKQIGLLRIFADQAVIAIENVRLFTELRENNRALSESLEQQTATSEILRVISSSPTDLQPVFKTSLVNANRLCDASFSLLWLWDGETLRAVAHENVSPEFAEQLRTARPRPNPRTPLGLTLMERIVIQVPDVLADPRFIPADVPSDRSEGARSILSVPMLREGDLVGVINAWRKEPRAFTDNPIELLKTFANQAVIAIENVRLFRELGARNAALSEALSQQTATAEILRVISSSPTEVEPVFEAIVCSAVRLCGGTISTLYRYDGYLVHFGVTSHPSASRSRHRCWRGRIRSSNDGPAGLRPQPRARQPWGAPCRRCPALAQDLPDRNPECLFADL